MDWKYTDKRSWKYCQSSTGVDYTGDMEDWLLHIELEENMNSRAEREKHHMDGMQENGKEQDEMKSNSRRFMFHGFH